MNIIGYQQTASFIGNNTFTCKQTAWWNIVDASDLQPKFNSQMWWYYYTTIKGNGR